MEKGSHKPYKYWRIDEKLVKIVKNVIKMKCLHNSTELGRSTTH